MSLQDFPESKNYLLEDVALLTKKDFMTRCANLPLEIKYKILFRCPLGTVKFLKRNTYFWKLKQEYDEAEFGKRAAMYWRPGQKRIIWAPRLGKLDLGSCKRAKGEHIPFEFEISYFWTELNLCFPKDHCTLKRPYRSEQWINLIGTIEELTKYKFRLQEQLLGQIPVHFSPSDSDGSDNEHFLEANNELFEEDASENEGDQQDNDSGISDS